MTENGGTLFTLGTKSGAIVTKDAEDVPFAQILHHVTPSELSRFENFDYEAEDEAERIHMEKMKPRGRPRKDGVATANAVVVPKTPKPRLVSGDEADRSHVETMRPRGRPRKDGVATANAVVVPKTPKPRLVSGDEADRSHVETMRPRGRPRKDGVALTNVVVAPKTPKPKPSSLVSGGYSAFRGEGQPKKRGRPVGWRKGGVPAALGGPVPSFNGPQPTGEVDTEPEMSTREQTEDLAEKRLDIQAKTGVYSMVSASGLGPRIPDSETEMDTREPTPMVTNEMDEPTPKRRRVEADVSSRSASFKTAPASPKAPSQSTSDEDERLDLLDQFTSGAQQILPNHPRNKTNEHPNLPNPSPSTAQRNGPSRSSSDQDERLNLLDQYTSNSQRNTSNRPKDNPPKLLDQPTSTAQPSLLSRSTSDEDERLNLLDQFTSNSQRKRSNRPKDNPPKRLNQPTSKAEPNLPSRSTSDEDERLNLLDQFTAKPHPIPARSTTPSTEDSMLSSVHYSSPTKQRQQHQSIPPLLHTSSTTTPVQQAPKRTSLTPHYPGSVGPIASMNGTFRHRDVPAATSSPSKSKTGAHKIHAAAAAAPTATPPAIHHRRRTLQTGQQPPLHRPHAAAPPQQQNATARSSTPRASTTGSSSSSLDTHQADIVRAMDSYFSPARGDDDDRNIDPRLQQRGKGGIGDSDSDSDSDSDPDSHEDEEGSGESFVGVVEPTVREEESRRPSPAPSPARPVEKRATAVMVVVSSRQDGGGAAKGECGSGGAVPGRGGVGGMKGNGNNVGDDRSTRVVVGDRGIRSQAAEQTNGSTNANADVRTVISPDDDESEDEDDGAGSIEL